MTLQPDHSSQKQRALSAQRIEAVKQQFLQHHTAHDDQRDAEVNNQSRQI